MVVSVNGSPCEFSGTLMDLLTHHVGCQTSAGVAVAVNGTVVSRSQWSQFRVGGTDEIEVVTAVQGG